MIPFEIIALIDDEEEHETLGPCGCSDYHMADCHIRTDVNDYADYEEEDWR